MLQLRPGTAKQVYICVCMCAKLLQSCLTLCDPMDCSPTDSSVHGILQARILEWLPFPPPGDLRIFPTQGLNPWLLCLLHWQASSLPIVPPGKPYIYIYRHRDQWNRIEIPEINSHIYGQLIFYNCATIIKWESNHLFNTWCRENRIFTCKRVNLDPVLVPVYEINSKWIKDSNIRAKTIKLLE